MRRTYKLLHIGSDGWDLVQYGKQKYLYKRDIGYLIAVKSARVK